MAAGNTTAAAGETPSATAAAAETPVATAAPVQAGAPKKEVARKDTLYYSGSQTNEIANAQKIQA